MTIAKLCTMFAKGIESGEGHPYKRWQSCRVYVDGRTIYSYGSHFPMAYIIAPNLVWLNGDRFSVSTGRHQAGLRSAISTHAPDATVVIVPQSALDAAGVDYRTIEPVDVHGERWEYIPHTSDAAPVGMSTELTEHIAEYTTSTQYYRCDIPENCERCKRGLHAAYHETEQVTVHPAHDAPLSMGYGTTGRTYSQTNAETWPYVVGYVDGEDGRQAVRHDPVSGEYRWHTARHWLGDAVFRSGGRYFISSFDKQERRPLYFLSQLPGPVDTVDAAIESLAPESVRTAIDMGRSVIRQGDMFAIATGVTTRQLKAQGATLQRRKVTVELRPRAAEQVAQRKALEAIMPTMGLYPTRPYWEDHSVDFKVWQDTVYKSYTAKCEAWTDELLTRVARHFPDVPEIPRYGWSSTLKFKPSTWDKSRDVDAGALYGTAHTATEIATMPDGRQFARGIMYHDPAVIGQTRAADHRRQPLGKQWHLIARNTVPVNGTGHGRRAA